MSDARKFPLRKIVGVKHHERLSISHEVLACGHLLTPRSDIYGQAFPEKRRCHKCAKGMPAEVSTEYPYGTLEASVDEVK